MSEEKYEKLVKRRSCMKSKLTIFNNYIKILDSGGPPSKLQLLDLESRFNKFETLHVDFDKIQSEIEMLSDDLDEEIEEREQFEGQFHKLVAAARNLLGAQPVQRASMHRDSSPTSYEDIQAGLFKSSCVRLPKIEIPVFHGHYQHWLEFRETFTSLIHSRNDIDNINKLHYLRACLKGSASLVIDKLDFRAENYDSAWSLLCSRYDNKRLLVNNHVSALFNIEQMQSESYLCIRRLIDVTNKNLRALFTLDQPTQYWDTLIIYMMAGKLDNVTHRKWEEHRNTLSDPPSLDAFINFLNSRADLLETLKQSISTTQKSKLSNTDLLVATENNNLNNKRGYNNKNQLKKMKSPYSCPMCNEQHYLFSCEAFRALSVEDRIQQAKESRVCMNCLRPGHFPERCSLTTCKYCKKKHSTLLHIHEPQLSADSAVSSPSNIINFSNSKNESQITTSSQILLSTALVKVIDSRGDEQLCRMLLDNGSTTNLITQSLSGKLGLSRRSASSTLTGINDNSSYITQSCSLTIISNYTDYRLTVDCFIIPHITGNLPSSYVEIGSIPLPTGIHLADPNFNVPAAIDLLVGAEVFWTVLCNNSIDLGKNQPRLYETKLGWLVSGYVSRLKSPLSTLVCNLVNEESNPDLTRFWELDTVAAKHSLSSEERACEQSFLENTVRKRDGRFVVTMPLKEDPSVLGDSYYKAKCRFLSLERKFLREPVFKDRYMDFMRDYEGLGHMTENKEPMNSLVNNTNYFLPHHGVIRESSLTTRLRTVFDASSLSSSGLSLNDIQMVGPTVQDDLYSILLRFRQHKYIVTGDIEKMYRAIELNPIQRSLQQIIFRYDSSEPLKTYTLNTLTYGTASAPYLATKCLVSLAPDAPDHNISKSIQRDFYVDDYIGGASTIHDTIKIVKGVIDTLKSAHFNLRKLRSNHQTILDSIAPPSSKSDNILDISNSDNINVSAKTLGLNWICDLDVLSFSINIELRDKVTKRHILSVISQVFDPLGLAGPCTVEAKFIMQRLWIEQCSWDQEVPQEIRQSWTSFAQTLPLLNQLKIPRWGFKDDSVSHEIHVFSDASERAYGACLYVRSVSKTNVVTIHLLTSKSRVAPIKPTTIPRLELCGALLAARLCVKVLDSLTISINKCTFWCDSMIVLGWLTTPTMHLKSFVRNRVHEIQDNTAGQTWSYVPSKDNPADLLSRGLKADHISDSALWWSGPTFLTKFETEWPTRPNVHDKEHLPELLACHLALDKTPNADLISDLIKRKSSVSTLQNIICYIKRFINNCINKTKLTGYITTQELKDSLTLIIQKSQFDMFPDEYKILKSEQHLPKKNRLTPLTPFLDKNNIIRVGGRLNNSPYCYNTKHPILLCSKHHFTKILFSQFHTKFLHAPPRLLLCNIRQTYWPLGGTNLAKNTVNKCTRCFRYKAEHVQPLMGQLPTSRTELEFPFLHCSVDYAGPVMIADRKGRGCKLLKSFLAIFICNSVKACHIELVTALSSEAYISALNRMVSRRGRPQSITSDRGTNFTGASNELAKLLVQSEIQCHMAQEGIEFKFVPAYTPHFNGLAEAAVRSTKHHLKRLLQTTHLNYEEMATCLTQIEAVLNSRPLTPLSSDPSDLSALTPAHFLIGRSLMSIPHPPMPVDVNINRLERHKRIESLKQHFWRRFSVEYIGQLQQKTKWTRSQGELKNGALVLIKDRALPPLLWSMGRVVKTYAGSDGVARVAEIKTMRGTIRRAFNNICPFPEC